MSVLSVVVCKVSEKKLADQGYRGLVRCKTCGHSQRVNTFTCLRKGWPKHCEETMEMVKEPEEPTP